jgi:hypothetical protein
MKYTYTYILLIILISIIGCSASQDLEDIANMKNKCKAFRNEYDAVKPVKSTKLIDAQVTECKDAGAWDEVKK